METPLLANPFWSALVTDQAQFAHTHGPACRFAAQVLPFAGVADFTPRAFVSLESLLQPGERVWVHSPLQEFSPGLQVTTSLPTVQMHLVNARMRADASTRARSSPDLASSPRLLGPDDTPAMLALTAVAFPGFFRPRTPELGRFFGLFQDGQLIAMCGERLALPEWREISTLCTHPEHTGRGHAQLLLSCLLELHAREGLRSFLHASATNTRAIRLYRHFGFEVARELPFHELTLA